MYIHRFCKTLILYGIIMVIATGCRFPVIISPSSNLTIDAGDSVSFEATSYTGAVYLWTFDGGAADTYTQNPTVQFNTPGIYDVNLIVVFSDLASGVDMVKVTVNDPSATVYTLTESSYEITRDTVDNKKLIWVVEKDGTIVLRRNAQGETSYTYHDNSNGEYRIWLKRFYGGEWSDASNIITYTVP